MSKGRILVVEDNMDNYELVRYVLERAGYDVFLAVNGRDGVDAARAQKPDLILMCFWVWRMVLAIENYLNWLNKYNRQIILVTPMSPSD